MLQIVILFLTTGAAAGADNALVSVSISPDGSVDLNPSRPPPMFKELNEVPASVDIDLDGSMDPIPLRERSLVREAPEQDLVTGGGLPGPPGLAEGGGGGAPATAASESAATASLSQAAGSMWPTLTPEKAAEILKLAGSKSGVWTTQKWPSYYSLSLPGLSLKGLRHPLNRHDLFWGDDSWPDDDVHRVSLDGKSFLDFGANMGGMLLSVADKLRWGVGMDLDPSLVNLGNTIANAYGMPITMHQLDIEKTDFAVSDAVILKKFPEKCSSGSNCVDVASMFAVNRWISNWKDAIRFLRKVSKHFIMEINWRTDIDEKAHAHWGAGMTNKTEFMQFMEKECYKVKYIDEALVKTKCSDCCYKAKLTGHAPVSVCRVMLHCYKAKSEGGYW